MADSFSNYTPPQGTAGSSQGPLPATTAEKKAHKEQPRIRRRNRLITSCLECRRRKLKCDKQQPCTNCTRFTRDCVFLAPALDPAGQAKLAEVKEKMGMLERTLEEDVVRRGSSNESPKGGPLTSQVLPGQDEVHSDEEETEDTKGLDPITYVTEDATYYEDDGNDELVDLGIQMGKLRITERIGGLVRPRFTEELAASLNDLPMNNNPFAAQRPSTWMAPGTDYVAPSSSFFFAPGVEKTSLMTYLPKRSVVDKLIQHYWRAVHVIARAVHRPSFEKQYERLWHDVSTGVEPRVSFQAVLMAALLSAVISMPESKVLAEFAVTKDGLVDNFRQGTESALARANFLRTTKLETLQAFVMYLIPLCRAEISRAHSALTGTCIRLAECMGLHRDPSAYSTSPIEIHVRRLIWYQLCFLDIRTCEATGPRPQIRRDEYDTRFPLNVDDVDLGKEGAKVPTEDANYFTDMTITRMRFECYEMQRVIWVERPKIDKKQSTLSSLLSKIQAFRRAMEEKYRPMMNTSSALHVLAMEIYGILSDRMYIGILQKYASNDKAIMPERLRTMMISSAVTVGEHSMVIEQTPALSTWKWYIGALHQYHPSLLLLHELYIKNPDPGVEARAWRCIDFCFDLPEGLSNMEKIRMVLSELIERTSMYASLRKLRTPTNMKPVGPRLVDRSKSPPELLSQQQQFGSPTAASPPEADRERSASIQSSLSSFSNFNAPPLLPNIPPSYQAQAQAYPSEVHLGGITSVGTADLSGITMPSVEQQSNYGMAYGTATMPPGPAPANVLTPVNYSDSSPSNTAYTYTGSGTGGSPMDVMPDIDWSEFEQYFGATEMPNNDILIPPFSFPQFSGQDLDLQWPQQM